MADYIDKEAMRTMLRDQEHRHSLKGLAWVEMAMDKLPTIPAPQWIRVEDEEPKIGVEVLTRDRYGNVRNRKLKMLSGLVLFYPDGLKPGKHITHWMPIPEPPKEVQND